MMKHGANRIEINQMRRLYGEGESVADISRLMMISEEAVNRLLSSFEMTDPDGNKLKKTKTKTKKKTKKVAEVAEVAEVEEVEEVEE